MQCIKCWEESWRSKFCRVCRETKQNAVSIVSQNRWKLIKLLNWDYLTLYDLISLFSILPIFWNTD